VTGPDGRFEVVYTSAMAESLRTNKEPFILHVSPPVVEDPRGWGRPARLSEYLWSVEYRSLTTEPVTVPLVPFWAHVRGTVVDADTGRPVPGITVSPAGPGYYMDAAYGGTTGPDGAYRCRLPAYELPWGQGVEALPEANRNPDVATHAKPVAGFWLHVNYGYSNGPGKGYRELKTRYDDVVVDVPLLSASTPDLYTEVNFRLPSAESALTPGKDLVTVVTHHAAPGSSPGTALAAHDLTLAVPGLAGPCRDGDDLAWVYDASKALVELRPQLLLLQLAATAAAARLEPAPRTVTLYWHDGRIDVVPWRAELGTLFALPPEQRPDAVRKLPPVEALPQGLEVSR
jgi:hypothetical protein